MLNKNYVKQKLTGINSEFKNQNKTITKERKQRK